MLRGAAGTMGACRPNQLARILSCGLLSAVSAGHIFLKSAKLLKRVVPVDASRDLDHLELHNQDEDQGGAEKRHRILNECGWAVFAEGSRQPSPRRRPT
jgi:hypothetical protein